MASSAAISSFSSRCALVSANLGLAETPGGLLGLGLGQVQEGCSDGLTSFARVLWEKRATATQPAATPTTSIATRAGERMTKSRTARLHANMKQPFMSVGEQG